MTEADSKRRRDPLLPLVAEIVAAYVSGNHVAAAEIPALVGAVREALAGLGVRRTDAAPARRPAVAVSRSIEDDWLICLEDGKRLKMLKRRLRTLYGLTPEAYRAKWGLPADYPMVAPNYSRQRSRVAKKSGLGRRPLPAQAA